MSRLKFVSAALFVLAFAIRLILLFETDRIHDLSSRKEMARTAIAFATKGELADPFAAPTGPTAHVPPLYPVFLGLLFRLFGTGVAGETIKCILTCAVSSARSALLPAVARTLGLGSLVGVVAGVMSAFYIGALNTEIKGDWEPPYTVLVLMGLFCMAARIGVRGRLDLRTAALQGLLWGIAVLLTSALAAILAGFLFLQALQWRRAKVQYLRWAVVVGGVAALTMSPWAIRNSIRLGSPVLAKDCLGIEMYVSNHPNAKWSITDEEDFLDREFPTRQPRAALELRKMGEVAYNQAKLRAALGWIRSAPAEFSKLVLLRAFHFWFPPASLPLAAISWCFTLAAVGGLYLIRHRAPVASWLIGSCWLFFPLIYYVAAWSSRYRYPIEWTMLLTAAVAVCTAADKLGILEWLSRWRLEAVSPPGDATGGVAAHNRM